MSRRDLILGLIQNLRHQQQNNTATALKTGSKKPGNAIEAELQECNDIYVLPMSKSYQRKVFAR